MRFEIDEIEYQTYLTIVSGNTSIGTIKGIWKSAEIPVIGGKYHIELSICRLEEMNIHSDKKHCPSVCYSDQTVVFKGICEDVDDDVYFVRFDIDWLEMISVQEFAVKKKKGDFMAFSADYYGIEIYPYTL